MKKVIYAISFALIACTVACNNPSTDKGTSTTTTITDTAANTATPTTQPTPTPAEPEGLSLINKSDCNTCHSATSKLIGPSYKDIAAKYHTPDNVTQLTTSVINGSSGVWGSVPMPGHPALPKTDVEKMIGYILSVK